MRILGLPQACCFSVLALILIYVAVNTASRSRRNGSRRGTAPATSFATYFVASFRHGALEPPGPQPADNACQRMEVVIFFDSAFVVPQDSRRRHGKCLPSLESFSHNCGVGWR